MYILHWAQIQQYILLQYQVQSSFLLHIKDDINLNLRHTAMFQRSNAVASGWEFWGCSYRKKFWVMMVLTVDSAHLLEFCITVQVLCKISYVCNINNKRKHDVRAINEWYILRQLSANWARFEDMFRYV